MNLLKYTIATLMLLSFGSCAVVKPYQMEQINQEDMSLSSKEVDKPETNFESYREGASGSNGGKTGGGCGCN